MSKIITLSNHKGGVGKTTSTINIGAALNQQGKRVLLIDLDPQANLTQSLRLAVGDPAATIYGALRGMAPLQPLEIVSGFEVIPSTLDLSGAEIELSSEAGREFILKELLDPLRSRYDCVLIDCPPSLGLLTLNALAACDQVLIPLQAEYLATQGLAKLLEVIEKIQKRLNKSLVIGGIFITQYDGRKVLNRNVVETVAAHFAPYLLATKIRDNVALAESPATGLDIFRYSPKSNGAEDYTALAQELLSKW
ncbi:ParA family protein [Fibrella forsythiae]|uniref:ParA family protein n=1 Tax=Fibrella forsythiae TaxID=2817061 RepID=A0ABS3JT15_9BACT|nr:ParA family protein [Fibrella forsythiae]MBO0953141.1 ParA family protein [Fibrella forsythiae]